MVRRVILSDRSLREAIAAGRIQIDPFDPASVQPSSIDVRVGGLFRVFRNHTAGVIDVKQDMTDLTELVEIPADGVFMLHPGEFVLGSTCERVTVGSDLVARIEGKALAVDTPIPTPTGWSTMGDLRVGDEVFTDSGAVVHVKDATEIQLGRPCYEVLFSDGSTMIADEAHEWLTTTTKDRRHGAAPSRRTTAEIAGSLVQGREYSHRVNLAGSVLCPPAHLPVQPYVIGHWIGGGLSTAGVIPAADGEVVDDIRSCNDDLFGNEHIPDCYLRASVQQRWWLLDGLMDSAGSCHEWGRCEFTTLTEILAEQVHELVAGLGLRPVLAKRPLLLDGVDHGPAYVVTFTPERPASRLGRTAVQQKQKVKLNRYRSIQAVRPVPSVPVRCIEVDHVSGVYLAGRSFIPTHNSSLGRLGLLIHSTAGFVDAGFDGHVTLELANVASLPITLYPGMKIGQLSFMQMTTPAEHPYGSGAAGSKYQGQRGPTPSRYFKNFE